MIAEAVRAAAAAAAAVVVVGSAETTESEGFDRETLAAARPAGRAGRAGWPR